MFKNKLHHVLQTVVPSIEDNGDKLLEELSTRLKRNIDSLPKDITAPLGKLRYPGMSKAYVDNNNTLDLTVTPVDMTVMTLTDPKDVATVVKHMGVVLDVICKMEQISIGHLHIDSLSDARANTFTRLEYLGISPIFDYTYINPWSGSYMGDWYGVSDLLTDHLEACMKLIRDSTTNTKPSNESVITTVALGISLIAISSLAVGVGKLVKKGLDKLESVISNAINKTYKKRVESTLSTLDQVRLFLDELPNRSTLPRSTSSGVWVSNLACSGKLDPENPMGAINGNIRLIADIGRAATTTCDKSDKIVSVILAELDYSAKVIATLPQSKIDGANEYVGSVESYSDAILNKALVGWADKTYGDAYNKISRMYPSTGVTIPKLGGNLSKAPPIQSDKLKQTIGHLLALLEIHESEHTLGTEVDGGDYRYLYSLSLDSVNKFDNLVWYTSIEKRYGLESFQKNLYQYIDALVTAIEDSTAPATGNESFNAELVGASIIIGGVALWETIKRLRNRKKSEPVQETPSFISLPLLKRIESLEGRVAITSTDPIKVSPLLMVGGKFTTIEDSAARYSATLSKVVPLLDKIDLASKAADKFYEKAWYEYVAIMKEHPSNESIYSNLVDYMETRFKVDENRMTSRINEHIETLEDNVSSLEAMQTALLCPETRDLTIVMCQGGVRSIGLSYGIRMAPSLEGRLPNHLVISTEVDNLLSISKATLSKLTQ